MFNESTMSVVAPIAQQLTAGNLMLEVKAPEYPLAVLTSALTNPVEPNQVGFSHELAVSTEDAFEAANEVPAAHATEEYATIATRMKEGMQAITYNARNRIVPAIQALVEAYTQRQQNNVAPTIEINVFEYDPVHSDPRLVNHISSRYAQVALKPSYRSFLMGEMSPEKIIEMVATNNPHMDQVEATDWLLKMGAVRISALWSELFGKSRELVPNQLEFLAPHRLPFTTDEITLAYCLVGHFIENPEDVIGESVSLEEWSQAMLGLHQLFGAYLLRAYQRRIDAIKRKQIVLSSVGQNPVETRTVSVMVNGEVYREWLEQGGEVEALLGAAVYAPQYTTAAHFEQGGAVVADRWRKLYPLIRQACIDNAARKRRQDIQALMLSGSRVTGEYLPNISYAELQEHTTAALKQVSEADLDNPYMVFAKVVCMVYFPNPIYYQFLEAMNRYSAIHQGVDARELATWALIDVAACWLADQVQVCSFEPNVDPNATLPQPEATQEGEAEQAENSDVISAVEGGLSQPDQEEGEVEEKAVEESEVEEQSETEESETEEPTETEEPAEGEEEAEEQEESASTESFDPNSRFGRYLQ